MKVRKLAVALALAGGLGSGVAQALGLGEIELQSYLNEPLDAEINLRKSEGVSPGDVFVNIAPQSAYERVGINRSFFLTKLNFQVTTAPNGSLVVNVSSREPLREPYLNFLIEVTWPNGRLMREYAVLVDPPVYAEESGVEEQVAAPTTTTRLSSQPQPSRQPAAPQARSTRQTVSGDRTLGPTNSTDTLWTIAAQIRPNNDVSMQQVMLAIQDLNPNAFIAGNINRLKRGEILRIPSENQIRSRNRAEANREVAAQNRALSSPERTVDATVEGSGAPAAQVDGVGAGDQLRLVAGDDEARDAAESGSAGGDGDSVSGADAGSAVAMEELESARRENEELTGRLDDLQDQVKTLQRLLELKNTQLAEMQSGQGGLPDTDVAVEPSAMDDDSVADSAAGSDADATDLAEADSSPESDDGVVQSQDPMSDEAAPESLDEAANTGAEMVSETAGDASEQSSPDQMAEPDQPVPEAAAAPAETAPAQKPFPGNIIDAISNNFIYQVALGGGLVVLLLLLLLLARRNANREKAFYDQLNNEAPGDEDGDAFDLTFDEEEGAQAPEGDPIVEADAYIAYGRNDQAAHTLETAISREPSRADLRLKLLGVYADIQDRESFDKQFREIEALDDASATAEAQSLQDRLEEAESMPSIDDLESQLRSGGSGVEEETSFASAYDIQDDEPPETGTAGSDKDSDAELDFEDMELELQDSDDDLTPTEGLEETSTEASSTDDRDDLIEYDLSNLEEPEALDDERLEDALKSEEAGELDEPFDFSLEESDLEETSEPAVKSGEPEADEIDIGDDGELDESFLDELDAELDKVAGEEDTASEVGGSELDDLELDVSDEDLALMEEFSESDSDGPADAPERAEEDELSLDDELGLEDALTGEEPSDPEQEVEGAEQADRDNDEVVPPVASDPSSARDSDRDIDESDLGDDDDFDFLSGTDEAATKLDLARAYVEMGDVDGARDILEEVALEGDEEQKAEAQDLLKNLS